ncbi:MAG: FAD-binding oxidoreductase [Gammaproteobacteria bacterium]|nr:FAD-binding oxidoreductase [Gammaproteobacteria bacterium]
MHNCLPSTRYSDALWMATAVSEPQTSALNESVDCDVAIVGAGITGLNSALKLAKAGLSVCVLEKSHLGFGASGRSGGQVNLGLNLGPSALLQRYGEQRGRRLIELVLRTPDTVFKFVKDEDLDCDPIQHGWVQGAINESVAQSQRALVNDYARHGYEFHWLNQSDIEQRTGTSLYGSGIFCDVAGSIHPLSYTRELARVGIRYGASIYTDSAVTGISRCADRWQLTTADGEVHASTVLLCTNGYTDSDTGKATQSMVRKIVPVRSLLVATEPLPNSLRDTVLPNQVTFVDKRRLILYMRYDREGRLCVGDHGPMRDTFKPGDFDPVKKRALRVFPQLRGVRWEYQWGGRVAMTKSSLPFLHQVSPGLMAGMGYNGRGVGMGTMLGQAMADAILSKSWQECDFPVTHAQSFVFHRLKDIGVAASIRWLSLLDHLDNRKVQI